MAYHGTMTRFSGEHPLLPLFAGAMPPDARGLHLVGHGGEPRPGALNLWLPGTGVWLPGTGGKPPLLRPPSPLGLAAPGRELRIPPLPAWLAARALAPLIPSGFLAPRSLRAELDGAGALPALLPGRFPLDLGGGAPPGWNTRLVLPLADGYSARDLGGTLRAAVPWLTVALEEAGSAPALALLRAPGGTEAAELWLRAPESEIAADLLRVAAALAAR